MHVYAWMGGALEDSLGPKPGRSVRSGGNDECAEGRAPEAMSTRSILVSLTVATAFQLAMVLAGHYVDFIKENVFALGGVAISLVAGMAYAKSAAGGWKRVLPGAVLVGGGSALLGIAVSLALKDVPAMVLVLGTTSSAVTGAIGGAIGLRLRKQAPSA
jgi:hypothetical protein